MANTKKTANVPPKYRIGQENVLFSQMQLYVDGQFDIIGSISYIRQINAVIRLHQSNRKKNATKAVSCVN